MALNTICDVVFPQFVYSLYRLLHNYARYSFFPSPTRTEIGSPLWISLVQLSLSCVNSSIPIRLKSSSILSLLSPFQSPSSPPQHFHRHHYKPRSNISSSYSKSLLRCCFLINEHFNYLLLPH